VNVTCSGLDLRTWDIALQTWGPVTLSANRNSITGSVAAGYDNANGGLPQSATPNWWGAASGPSGGGPGTGGAVAGPNVTFSPWLTNGTDFLAGVGFAPGPDNVVGPVAPSGCMSIANPVLVVPVTISRTTSDNIRGFSVRVQLSPNLQLATNLSSITQGTYLSAVGATTFQVLDRGAGQYSVDCAILGTPCGATALTGTLFSIAVKRVPGPDGTGTVSTSSVILRDCVNSPVAGSSGAAVTFPVDATGPAAIADLVATQWLAGNDMDGTTKIQLGFTPPAGATSIEVYRAPFGHYPYYDNEGGAVPAIPSYPPAAPWTLTAVNAAGQSDEPAARDFWYYVAFSHDACGNVSAASNRTLGRLNYHLGDVVNPSNALAIGNNRVDIADISRLGAHYGITLGVHDALGYLDVGPTSDLTVQALPNTDGVVDFEDLILFATNYQSVSAPSTGTRPAAAAQDALSLEIPALPETGRTFDVAVRMTGAGDVAGTSVKLAWDPSVVEPLGVAAGDLLSHQDRGSVVLSPAAGTVDVALLGEGGGLVGDGRLALVSFRVKAGGGPGIRIDRAIARDAANRPVTIGTLAPGGAEILPARTELGSVFPNPFGRTASVQLSLAREAKVKVGVYDLAGRRVRSLVDGVQPAGVRVLTFDGRGDSGVRLAPGVYVLRLETPDVAQSRRLHLVP
jgi:hypothetical protein